MRKLLIILFFITILTSMTLLTFILQKKNPTKSISFDKTIPKHADITITLSRRGFFPQEVNINKGSVVKFITVENKQFWPASDLHPTHELYGEFDPQEPIEPKGAFYFTFTKSGKWKFHDHLFPYYTGTIVVNDKI